MIAPAHEPIEQTKREERPYCGLIGHVWAKCYGGVECCECKTVILDRIVILPDLALHQRIARRALWLINRIPLVVLQLILAALMIFGALWVSWVRYCL